MLASGPASYERLFKMKSFPDFMKNPKNKIDAVINPSSG
jgi:hypothetical protein